MLKMLGYTKTKYSPKRLYAYRRGEALVAGSLPSGFGRRRLQGIQRESLNRIYRKGFRAADNLKRGGRSRVKYAIRPSVEPHGGEERIK